MRPPTSLARAIAASRMVARRASTSRITPCRSISAKYAAASLSAIAGEP